MPRDVARVSGRWWAGWWAGERFAYFKLASSPEKSLKELDFTATMLQSEPLVFTLPAGAPATTVSRKDQLFPREKICDAIFSMEARLV